MCILKEKKKRKNDQRNILDLAPEAHELLLFTHVCYKFIILV